MGRGTGTGTGATGATSTGTGGGAVFVFISSIVSLRSLPRVESSLVHGATETQASGEALGHDYSYLRAPISFLDYLPPTDQNFKVWTWTNCQVEHSLKDFFEFRGKAKQPPRRAENLFSGFSALGLRDFSAKKKEFSC